MALSRVQATAKISGTAGSFTMPAFATPPTVGNALVLPVSTWISQNTVAITDNHGNTYTLAGSTVVAVGDIRTSIWYCARVAASGSPFTITITVTPGTYCLANAIEVSGVGSGLAVDQIAGQAGGASTNSKTTGATPPLTAAEVFVVAALGLRYGPTTLTVETVTPAWTQEYEELNAANIPGEADSRILTSATGSTPSCSWTLAVTSYGPSQIVAFKAGAPATVPAPDLTGKTRAEAIKAIQDAGFTVGSIMAAPDRIIPKDQVMAQSPPAGAAVAPGSVVNLVISTGPDAAGANLMPTLTPPLTVSAAQIFDTSLVALHSLGTRMGSIDGRAFVYVRTLAAATPNTWLQAPANLTRTAGVTNVDAFEPMVTRRVKLHAGAVTPVAANVYVGGLLVDDQAGTTFHIQGHEAIAANQDFWLQLADADLVPRSFPAARVWTLYVAPYESLTVAAAAGGPIVGLWQGYSTGPAYGWAQTSGESVAWCSGAIATDAPLGIALGTANTPLVVPADSTAAVLGRALVAQASGTAYLPIMLTL